MIIGNVNRPKKNGTELKTLRSLGVCNVLIIVYILLSSSFFFLLVPPPPLFFVEDASVQLLHSGSISQSFSSSASILSLSSMKKNIRK